MLRFCAILLAFILLRAENLNASILNNVKDPCISELVNISISENMTNEISTLIKNCYNVNDSINLTIDQVYDLENLVDATTNDYYNSFGVLSIDISFNGNTMPTASREYVMATLYHEFLHAILVYNEVKNGQYNCVEDGEGHEPMADGYRKILVDAFLQHFPALSKADALKLAWGGLHGTKAWNKLSESERVIIINTNMDYRTKKKGSGCN